MLIRGIMRRRFWWQVIDKCNEEINFVWSQIKINEFFNLQTAKPNDQLKLENNNNNNNKPEEYGLGLRKVQSAVGHSKKIQP
jgi:hypothetical protein